VEVFIVEDAPQTRQELVELLAAVKGLEVKLGERTIGFLQTGQVTLELPSAASFWAMVRQLTDLGVPMALKSFEDAYYPSRALSPDQYGGVIRLLEIFARQLSAIANRTTIQDAEAESPQIRRVKAYLAGHYGDPVDLPEIASVMHVSTFYFCKMFRKATGLTFTAQAALKRTFFPQYVV
jgi:hypothetical protein